MNPLWKTYKSKVMKTLNAEMEEDVAEEEESEVDTSPIQQGGEEGPNVVSQLSTNLKKMQGASVKGWKSVSALFNKEDEHQLLSESEGENHSEPEPINDHPLAVRPEEPASSRSNKRMTGFWDNFATKFQQAKQAQAAAAAAMAKGAGSEADVEAGIDNQGQSVDGENQEAAGGGEGEGGGSDAAAGGEDGDGGGGNSFSKYTSLGGGNGDTSLKWNFVTGKLAELKMKSMAKTN
ncbi:uncharacterized protein C1orf232 [Engraulis encrasicolus]|uniref:uncharacterized protein C1orf232 n=1 Tax=Engraulis encrasicolus TaxID=184585 RepID=UPI002FCEEAF6